MRVGIIGYGLAGRVFHARLLATVPDATIVGVVTRDPSRRAEACVDRPGVVCHDTTEDLLAAGGLDLVVIATANSAHASPARLCVDAGVAVVVDKPLAIDADAAESLVRYAAEAGVPLTVFQNRRLDADQVTLRRLRADGMLGRILRYESRFERWRPDLTPGKWREQEPAERGGGQLLDLGSHLVDQAIALFGPVRSVYAEIDARRGAADDDVYLALTHADGTYAHLWFGAMTAAPGPRLRVNGDRAALIVDELDGQEAALRAGLTTAEAVPQTMRLVRGDDVETIVPDRGAWDTFYPAVLAAIRDGSPMPVDPLDAVATLRVLDAARLAATEHRTVDPAEPPDGHRA